MVLQSFTKQHLTRDTSASPPGIYFTAAPHLSIAHLCLQQLGRFRLDIRKHFFLERVVMQWHSCPGWWCSPLSMEVFKNHVDVALRDVVSGHGGGGLRLDKVILEGFSSFNDSMIL